jgi:hypothetical protein
MGQTALLPLRRKACWGFFRLKNPTASAGFEPANLGTKGQHATPRPPKPLVEQIGEIILYSSSNTIQIITTTEIRLRPRSTRDYKKCICL